MKEILKKADRNRENGDKVVQNSIIMQSYALPNSNYTFNTQRKLLLGGNLKITILLGSKT